MPNPTYTTDKPTANKADESKEVKQHDLFDWLTLLLPILATLITFLLAYKLNKLFDNDKEKERLADIKKYFLALADSLVRAGKSQSVEMLAAVSRLTALKGNNFSVVVKPELNDERIKSISNIDLYKIFIDSGNAEKRTEQLNALSTTLTSLDNVKNLIKGHNDNISSHTESFNQNCTNIINSIFRMRDDIVRRIQNQQIKDEVNAGKLITELDRITNSSKDAIKINEVLASYELMGKPLYESAVIRDTKTEDKDIETMILMIKDLHRNYVHFKNKMDILIQILNNANNTLNTSVGELEGIITEIKS